MELANLFSSGNTDLEKVKNYMQQVHDYQSNINDGAGPIVGMVDAMKYEKYLEDKTLPENPTAIDDVIADTAKLFQGVPRWGHPGTMLNVIPPANLLAAAMANYADLLNINFSQDHYAGISMSSELEVVKYISDLANWDWRKSAGVFTFGGKSTNLYGLRCSINRASPNSDKEGLAGNRYFFVTSVKGHPCHHEVAGWLGLGFNSCIKIPCDDFGRIDLVKTRHEIETRIQEGMIFLGINLTGGSTVELEIDDIKGAAELRDIIVQKHGLNYQPMIHVDAVVGWAWLFFKGYDFDDNPLNITPNVLSKIKETYTDISGLEYADSFGVDFHKTGFTPYISSLFIVKNRDDLYKLGEKKSIIPFSELEYGNYSPFEYTLELTRSGRGPIAALTALKSLGMNGYRELFSKLLENIDSLRSGFSEKPCITLLNPNSRGLAALFIVKPPEYEHLELQQLLSLSFDETEKIKSYNVDFGYYVEQLCRNQKISFVFTATDAFAVNNTNVFLGMQKAYPMSPFASQSFIKEFLDKLDVLKINFDKGEYAHNILQHKPVDMVYRK